MENDISLDNLDEPLKVFDGNARDGARGFPANVNVAAALSLAGIGADETALEIWADPTLTRNVHRIAVEADSASFSLMIENVPTEENQRDRSNYRALGYRLSARADIDFESGDVTGDRIVLR